jgi:cellulose synthase/poly-beta-1,6-N-acetylglucosamine synthase-like glycosyltransferase
MVQTMVATQSLLKLVQNQSDTRPQPDPDQKNIGRVLLSKNWITEGDILKAWSIQRYEDAAIGEILIGMGLITIDQLYWALAELHDLEVIDFESRPPTLRWADVTDPQIALQKGYITWRKTDRMHTFAITDPNTMEEIKETYGTEQTKVNFVLVKPVSLQAFIAKNQCNYLQKKALMCCPETMSSRSWAFWTKSNSKGLFLVLSLITIAFLFPALILQTALSLITAALVLLMGFRISCLLSLQKPDETHQNITDSPNTIKRPKVSLLVPLYKESRIIERLFQRLQVLAYPKELLEIVFINEENDTKTRDSLAALNLPFHMKIIEVPNGQLQTKPRAMNFALDFCSGSIIGIYDAEDAPEINQIERVIQKFAASDDKVACIQCILDFYNPRTNWMSRCFTIEYAILFRLILPALDRMKLPIPLGGTSVFFRRDILEKLGRWDAYNVTEDADLGYRLYRMGYRCSWINTVTYEEANYRMIPWIKQRSRWLKGLFLTVLVHFKRPAALSNEIGILATLSMVCLTIIPWILSPLAPIILPIWILSFGMELPIYSTFPDWFTWMVIITFIATELMTVYLGFKATDTAQHKHLRLWLLTTIFYWPIACFASYKALFEVFVRPVYWDKSEHGLNDRNYTKDIRRLTRSSG